MAINFSHEPSGQFLAIHNPIIFEFGNGEIADIKIEGEDESFEIKANADKTFYFDASELLQSFFNRDFEDPNQHLEDSESVFFDDTLSKKVKLIFSIEGETDVQKDYTLFQSAKDLGSSPLVGDKELITLKIHTHLPISKGEYQEISVYSNKVQTVDNKALKIGINRIRINGSEDVNVLKANFDIDIVEQQFYYDGMRVKYFSRSGCWIYLRSLCNYSVRTEVSNLGRYEKIRGNVESSTSNFTTLGKVGFDTYSLGFVSNEVTRPYIRDLLLSPKVFLRLMDKWFEAEISADSIVHRSDDSRTIEEMDFRLSEIDTLQLT